MSHLNITVVGDRALLGGYDAYIPSDPVQSAVEIERFRVSSHSNRMQNERPFLNLLISL